MSRFGQLLHEALRSPGASRLRGYAQALREAEDYQTVVLTPKMWILPDGADNLEKIDRMERLTRVQKLQVVSDPKDQMLDVTLQLNIYFTES